MIVIRKVGQFYTTHAKHFNHNESVDIIETEIRTRKNREEKNIQ